MKEDFITCWWPVNSDSPAGDLGDGTCSADRCELEANHKGEHSAKFMKEELIRGNPEFDREPKLVN